LAALLPVFLAAAELTLSFPEEIPEASDVAGWERIEGRAELGVQSIDYVLYVDPRHPALYRLTRYRITLVTRNPEGREVRLQEEEKVVWNARPGVRVPLHCYALGDASQQQGRWRAVGPGSDEYRTAMMTVMHLYGHHRNQNQARVP